MAGIPEKVQKPALPQGVGKFCRVAELPEKFCRIAAKRLKFKIILENRQCGKNLCARGARAGAAVLGVGGLAARTCGLERGNVALPPCRLAAMRRRPHATLSRHINELGARMLRRTMILHTVDYAHCACKSLICKGQAAMRQRATVGREPLGGMAA
jgi:hypothetical protein